MNIVEPSVEYWQQEAGMEGVWNQIARATRVCYQSKPREGESSEDFVKRIILKPALIEGNLNDLEHCKFDFDKMHGAMLEHGTVYLTLKQDIVYTSEYKIINNLLFNSYSKYHFDGVNKLYYVTTNMRVILENNLIYTLHYIDKPTDKHNKRYTFSVITDIGVTREMNRHRTFSVAEQSTRYCCYDSNKFGNELTYVKPAWESKDKPLIGGPFADMISRALFSRLLTEIKEGINTQWTAKTYYIFGLLASEFAYMGMRENKEVTDKCRQVLNLNTKTQAVYTAFTDDWKHFLKLRADNVSGKAHPNIQLIAKQIKSIIENL